MPARFLAEVYRTDDAIYCVDPRDQYVSRSIIDHGTYAADEITNLRALLPPNASILIIGAHIGALVIPLSKTVANLACIEANPDTFRLLEMNLMLNRCNNVMAFNYAANAVEGELEFIKNTHNSGGSKRMPVIRDARYFYDDPDVVVVSGMPMDKIFPNARFDLIFMDIEGSEYSAFQGMKGLIAATSVLVCEFIPHHLELVAGVTVEQFLAPLADFDSVVVPSLKKVVRKPDIGPFLSAMVAARESDSGIIFLKDRSGIIVNF